MDKKITIYADNTMKAFRILTVLTEELYKYNKTSKELGARYHSAEGAIKGLIGRNGLKLISAISDYTYEHAHGHEGFKPDQKWYKDTTKRILKEQNVTFKPNSHFHVPDIGIAA